MGGNYDRCILLETGQDGKPFECWIWQACTNKAGYGIVRCGPKNKLAHRHSYELSIGTIPPGLLIMHTCDNPPCVNPFHLKLGTSRDNSMDAANKGRMAAGERSGQSVLTDVQVAHMRYLHMEKGVPNYKLAELFGIARSTVFLVLHNITWKHVDYMNFRIGEESNAA